MTGMRALMAWLSLALALSALAPAAALAQEGAEPDVLPELVHFAPAAYPRAALRAGIEGDVLLELLVNARGEVDSVTVVEPLEPSLDAAASSAAARFRFTPARVAGEAVPVRLLYSYAFSLRDEARKIAPVTKLRGRVLERGSGRPLVDATVVLHFPAAAMDSVTALPWPIIMERLASLPGQFGGGDSLVAYSDSTGGFRFSAIPPGLLRVVVRRGGFRELDTRVNVPVDGALSRDFALARSSVAAYELVVEGHDRDREVSRQRLTAVEVETLPGFGGDAVRSVQSMPGVARPVLADPGSVTVRGSGSYDTRFFLDGVDIPLLFHYGGVKSTYNSLALGSVDLYPGGYGASYGGCVGGVVELRGRPGRRDHWRRIVDAGLLDASFHAEGPLGERSSLLLTGRRSFVGEVLRAVLSGSNDYQMTLSPYYWDLVARYDFTRRPEERFFVTAFAARDRMDLLVPSADQGDPSVNAATNAIAIDASFSRFILGYDRPLGERFDNMLRASYGRSQQRGHVFGYFDFDLHGPNWQLRDELTAAVHSRVDATLGLDLNYAPVHYAVRAQDWPAALQNRDSSDLGAYLSVEWRPTESLLLRPSVRVDDYWQSDATETSLRMNARWRLGARHALNAALGSYNQPSQPQPTGSSLQLVDGGASLPPTLGRHAVLGEEWRISPQLRLETQLYYNTQRRIPVAVEESVDGYRPSAEARMGGLELTLRRESGGRFFGWLSYTLSRSERKTPVRPANVTQEPDTSGLPSTAGPWDPDRWVLYALDQTHHLEALGSWRVTPTWSLGLRLQVVSGNPVTPLLNYDSQQFEFDADTGDYQQVLGDYLSDRRSPYVRCDMRVDKRFVRGSSIWQLYLDVQNLGYFLYNSPEGYDYNYDFSERRDYGWIILPALGCRVEF